MTTIARHSHTVPRAVLALIGIFGAIGSASAQQPTLNTSGLTPQQCYQKDSDCTQFCGAVTGDLRYECFAICDRMLTRCLTTGDWDDSPLVADPVTNTWPDKTDQLSSLLIRMLMVAGDTDQDGLFPLTEIEALKSKVFVKEEPVTEENPVRDIKTKTETTFREP
jgi:hypothetical protein